MIRVLIYVILIALLAAGFAWLADRPGELVLTFEGYQYEVTLMVAAVGVAALTAAVMLSWWIVKGIWNSPYTVTRYFRVRQRDRGYQALSTGIIAAGAGDVVKARQLNKQAAKLLKSDQEPLIHLLEAQTLELEGDSQGARVKYERMVDDPETRLLGLHGLYRAAERDGNREAARHFANKAAELAPQLGWASDESLSEKVTAGDWDGALKVVEGQRACGYVGKAAASRRKAVVLTARALASFDQDFASARTAALEANRLEPTFAPAALVAARALFRGDETRKGSKLLEAAWKALPTQEIADLYVRARPGDSTHDHLERARRLAKLRQNNADSSLAVAHAAFEAQEYDLARREAEDAIRLEPRESAYMLLADIEEATSGDIGKARQWLARAVRAPRDPAWVADGVVSRTWAPVSPVTGHFDAFEWRAPVEEPAPMIELDPPEASPALEPPKEAAREIVIEAETVEPEPPVEEVVAEESAAAPPAEPEEPTPEGAAPPEPAKAEEPVFRLPDDPGVEPAKEPPKRFRLF